jgi:hypothetical protein
MRLSKIIVIAVLGLCLSACVSSLLIGNQLQSKLMWSFLKPLVGFDPNSVNFFEAPIIKNRMTAILGDKYEPTMKLLRTAQEIQQEGALFYVASRYAPAQAQAITDKAGLVWNSQTNQLAVMLIQGGKPEIFSEQIAGAKEAITPALPQELQNALSKAQELQKALNDPAAAMGEALDRKLDSTINDVQQEQKNKLEKTINKNLPDVEGEDLDEALKREVQGIN